MSGGTGNQYELTPNFGLKKPWLDADDNQWGGHLNDNMDLIDVQMQSNRGEPGPPGPPGGLPDAPTDGNTYGRNSGFWVVVASGDDVIDGGNF